MNGIYGFNVTDFGMSRDNIVADVRACAGAWVLVRNSPELARMCAVDLGMNVVYRVTGDDEFDRPLERHPRDLAEERISQVSGLPRVWIHALNEVRPSQAQNLWTLEFMRTCEKHNRRAVVLNYATHRSALEWEMSRPVLEHAIREGHAVGIHVYLNDSGQDSGAWEWRRWQSELGGLWIATEFAYIRDVRDAYKGWRGTIAEAHYASFLRKYAHEFTARRMPALLFSYEHWPLTSEGRSTGFGIFDARQLLASIASINRENTWSSPMAAFNWGASSERTVTALRDGVQYVNIRIQPTTASTIVGQLRVGDKKQVSANTLRADGWDWQRIEHAGAHAYVASNLITWNDVSAPPPPVPPVDPDALFAIALTADEVQQLINLHRQQAMGHNAIADIYAVALSRTGGTDE